MALAEKAAEQIATVRDLLARGGAAWGRKQVAASFKGAKLAEVEAVLESLAARGLLVPFAAGKGLLWRQAGASVPSPAS